MFASKLIGYLRKIGWRLKYNLLDWTKCRTEVSLLQQEGQFYGQIANRKEKERKYHKQIDQHIVRYQIVKQQNGQKGH